MASSQRGDYRNEPETRQEGSCRWHHGSSQRAPALNTHGATLPNFASSKRDRNARPQP